MTTKRWKEEWTSLIFLFSLDSRGGDDDGVGGDGDVQYDGGGDNGVGDDGDVQYDDMVMIYWNGLIIYWDGLMIYWYGLIMYWYGLIMYIAMQITPSS